jgi:hypothetical protein
MSGAVPTGRALGACIRAAQGPSGLIGWFPGGHGDPWNHVEAAMALDTLGETEASRAAYAWLFAEQSAQGSWAAYYAADGTVEEARVDTNATSYVATGVAHHFAAHPDDAFLEEAFPVLEAALDFVSGLARPSGAIPWSLEGAVPGTFALLAASCSIYQSLGSGLALAAHLGARRPQWAEAQRRLRTAIVQGALAGHDPFFADKSEFAMDWYYPVLAGCLEERAARRQLAARWCEFVHPGEGVRCRADRRWVTTAETAELALALLRLGRRGEAVALLDALGDKAGRGGSYLTGLVYPERSSFPTGEESTYSAAAALLARDALAGGAATTAVLLATRRATASEPQERVGSGANSPLAQASR